MRELVATYTCVDPSGAVPDRSNYNAEDFEDDPNCAFDGYICEGEVSVSDDGSSGGGAGGSDGGSLGSGSDPNECPDSDTNEPTTTLTDQTCGDDTGGSGGGSDDPGDEPAACDLDGDGFILGDKEEACSTTSDLSLTDDYVVNADTSEYNCNEKPDGKYEAAWCASSEPTGEERKLTKETLAKLKQRGGECAAIAQRGYELLQRGMIRYYPDNVIYGVNKNRDNFGGFAIPGIVALLGEAAVTYLGEMGKTQQVTDKDGSTVTLNFAFVLAHEIEHQMGRSHLYLPNGKESDWLTPNVKYCSGVK